MLRQIGIKAKISFFFLFKILDLFLYFLNFYLILFLFLFFRKNSEKSGKKIREEKNNKKKKKHKKREKYKWADQKKIFFFSFQGKSTRTRSDPPHEQQNR